jgi:hypothetical protein
VKFSKHEAVTFFGGDATCSSEILIPTMPDYPREIYLRLGGPHANSWNVITIESKKKINKK